MPIFGDTGRYNPKSAREYLVVGNSGNGGLSYFEQFQIPKNASMVMLYAMGGGGGGGAGVTGATSTNKGGGGGGGSGGTSRLLIPARFLPRVIYLCAPAGTLTAGTPSGTAGVVGGQATISAEAGEIGADIILYANPGFGGNGGTSGGGGTGGSGGSVASAANGQFSNMGVWSTTAGNAGGNGTLGTAASAVNFGGGAPNCGGGGGGGASSGNAVGAGGGITGAGLVIPTLTGGAGSVSSNGGNGPQGLHFEYPMLSCGGCGGGGNATGATGGTGGVGGWGSGGGGGGAGVTFGPGANGGPAVIYIAWW